jgi:PPOX class probable F420-dependent enzyme
MTFSDKERAYLEKNHGAAMITLRPDGTPHAVRVGVALVDDKLWSSGIPGRVRTKHLRRDPRCTVFVFEAGFGFMTLETRATILDGPDAAELNLRLFQVMQAGRADPNKLAWYGQDKTLDEFQQTMRDEQRLIYEFEPLRTYGLF